MEEKNSGLKQALDILGGVLAFLTIALYAVLIVNATWTFIPEGSIMNILLIAKTYASLVLIGIVGLEFVINKTFVTKIVFLVLVAIVVIFQFFPGTWANITTLF